MSNPKHPWCRDVSRDEAIRAAEDDAAIWRRLEVGEVIEDGDEFLSAMDGQWRRTAATGTPAVGSIAYRRRRVPLPDHRDLPQAVKELRERVARLEDHFADASKMVAPPQPAPVTPADGLRTEPVTLRERTPGEAAAYAEGMAATVVADLIRERDAAKEECERRLTMCESMKRERDTAQFNVSCLKARVAELEGERDAARKDCEMLREDAVSADIDNDRLRSQRDAARGDAEKLKARVAALNAALNTAPAANAGGEQSQPPRGWLTSEERRTLENFVTGLRTAAMAPFHDEAVRSSLTKQANDVEALLARSTPPKVRRPHLDDMESDERPVWESACEAWIAAIRAAGGEVQDG